MIVKMPNGDVEHFESAGRWRTTDDGALTLYPPGDGDIALRGSEVARFAPGAWWMARKLPESGPCSVCGQRPSGSGRNRCLTGGKFGRHVYIEDFDADEAA